MNEKGKINIPINNNIHQNLSGQKILIVNGNESEHKALKAFLKDWGLLIDEAMTINETIYKLYTAHSEGEPFSIAIIDEEIDNLAG